MVLLEVTAKLTTSWDNIAVINPNIDELKCFREITITKSNGKSHRFRLILSSEVPVGAIHIGKMESRMYRFHLGHKYHVEGVESPAVFQTESSIDFSKMNTAGYSVVMKQIIERVFAPRKLPSELCDQFGIQFIRGVILYGPPGTGKTSLIKSLCEYFNLQPQIIHGPQLLNSLLGKSEEAVRLLFEEAINDQEEKGDSSPLHVFVFDEMDALFSKRSSENSSDTRNGIVNQLLSMMDGYEQLNNILIFGTTNRLDIIDPALLRGGRFELSIKIDLPTAQDRLDILKYHLKKPRENGRLASDISMANLQQLVCATENCSGADLAQIVRIAITEASKRLIRGPIVNLEKMNIPYGKNALLKWNDLVCGFHYFQQLRQEQANIAKPKENKDSE